MANDCWYNMCVIGSLENIERLHRIMKYEDPNLYIYRVFDAYMDEPVQLDSGSYMAYISGDVAWGISSWLEDIPKVEKSYDGKKDNRLYVNLRFLSDLLHLDIEIQSEESGMAFQQHCYIINGEIEMYQDCTWFDLYYDRDDYEDTSEIIEDINRIISEYNDLKEVFREGDFHKKMVDEIYSVLEKDRYLSIELGGYGRDTIVGDGLLNDEIERWETIPYQIIQ